MHFEDLSVVPNIELECENNSYKKLSYFIQLEQKPLNDFSESFSIPLVDSEFCASLNYILLGSPLIFRIFKYDQNMTLKLKLSVEFQLINFVIRKMPKDGRILIYKIILALYEQNVNIDCPVFVRSRSVDKENAEGLKKCYVKSESKRKTNKKTQGMHLHSTLLELLISFLNPNEIIKTKFSKNLVQITYKNGTKKIFDSHMNRIEGTLEFTEDRMKISKNKLEILSGGSVIYEKKMKEIRQQEIIESTLFCLSKDEIFVCKFLN